LGFFADATVRHFREEEELLFPTVVDCEQARELLVQALLEHQLLHALAARLQQQLAAGEGVADVMQRLGELLEAHVRLEERRLFPVIEQLLEQAPRTGLAQGGRSEPGEAEPRQESGPLWGAASDDLNATLFSWKAGSSPPEHINEERDVLVVVLDGSAILRVDGKNRTIESVETLIIAKGEARKLTAGATVCATSQFIGAVRRFRLARPRRRLRPSPADDKGGGEGGSLCQLDYARPRWLLEPLAQQLTSYGWISPRRIA